MVESQKPQAFVRNYVLPYLQEGKTVSEIAELTEFSPNQIRNVRERARAKGMLPHPTKEETWAARSKARKGFSGFTGHTHSAEYMSAIKEQHLGRQLSETEREEIQIIVAARQAVIDRQKPTLAQLFHEHERPYPTTGSWREAYLQVFYAARICTNTPPSQDNQADEHQASFVAFSDLEKIRAGNPEAVKRTRRLAADSEFIVEQTLSDFEKAVRTAQQIPSAYGKPSYEVIYEESGKSLDGRSKLDNDFIRTFYAARISMTAQSPKPDNSKTSLPYVSLDIVNSGFESIDPEIFERLRPDIDFIVSKTTKAKSSLLHETQAQIDTPFVRTEQFYQDTCESHWNE